ncbi:MAG: hypothetical protein E6105_09885 [Finegoldia magna]|nr:hypothetical protein [Clostridium paraputrificum]MDU5443085.1 hypothetical protein [Finegoldia magna]
MSKLQKLSELCVKHSQFKNCEECTCNESECLVSLCTLHNDFVDNEEERVFIIG